MHFFDRDSLFAILATVPGKWWIDYWNLKSGTSLVVYLQNMLSEHVLLSLTFLPLIEPFPILIFNLGLL